MHTYPIKRVFTDFVNELKLFIALLSDGNELHIQFASTTKVDEVSLPLRSRLYLQHGGGNYSKHNDVTVSPCIQEIAQMNVLLIDR